MTYAAYKDEIIKLYYINKYIIEVISESNHRQLNQAEHWETGVGPGMSKSNHCYRGVPHGPNVIYTWHFFSLNLSYMLFIEVPTTIHIHIAYTSIQ